MGGECNNGTIEYDNTIGSAFPHNGSHLLCLEELARVPTVPELSSFISSADT